MLRRGKSLSEVRVGCGAKANHLALAGSAQGRSWRTKRKAIFSTGLLGEWIRGSTHLKVQVATARSLRYRVARMANVSYNLALENSLARTYGLARKMSIKSHDSVRMQHSYKVAGHAMVSHPLHHSSGRGICRPSARAIRKIHGIKWM